MTNVNELLQNDANEKRSELIERVARFIAMGVPTAQIASACGLTPERVATLEKTEVVRDIVAGLQTEQLEQHELLMRGWDAVESEAVGSVLTHLRANPDPDYALRAAAVANKAVRHNGTQTQPGVINVDKAAVATIVLSNQYIVQLKQEREKARAVVSTQPTDTNETPTRDVMPLQDAQQFLDVHRNTRIDRNMDFDINSLFGLMANA